MSAIPMFDQQSALGFVISQTSIIEPYVYDIRYPDVQYRDLIPVDTTGSEYATSVTYFSQDRYGKADWINGNADDIPLAGTTRAKYETPVHTAAIGYGFGWEEIGRARMLGLNLPNEDAMAARRAAEEMVDRVALLGDVEKGFQGLFNYGTITPVPAPSGGWASATPDQILNDLNQGILNVFNGTNTTAMADTVLLPWSKFQKLATTPRSNDSDETILAFFLRNNFYTAVTGRRIEVRGVRELDKAGAGQTTRAIFYRRDPGVLKLHMPMPHRFLPVWQAGPLRWEIPGVMRLGGLDIRLPREVTYLDGI